MEQGHESRLESQPLSGTALETSGVTERRPLEAWEGYSPEILDDLLDS
jgi:hypothetical protein